MKLHQIFLYLVVVAFLVSCKAEGDYPGLEYAPQMYHSVPYEGLSQVTNESEGMWLTSNDNGYGEFYTSNPNNPNRMNMREPVPNTVRRNGGILPYRYPKDSLEIAAVQMNPNPTDSSQQVLAEGKVLYTRFCSHCHGDQGQGDGLVGQVLLGVTSYTSRAVINRPEGHIFHVITHGKGRMGAHGSQISETDRWKIVRYVQVLQQQ